MPLDVATKSEISVLHMLNVRCSSPPSIWLYRLKFAIVIIHNPLAVVRPSPVRCLWLAPGWRQCLTERNFECIATDGRRFAAKSSGDWSKSYFYCCTALVCDCQAKFVGTSFVFIRFVVVIRVEAHAGFRSAVDKSILKPRRTSAIGEGLLKSPHIHTRRLPARQRAGRQAPAYLSRCAHR